MPPEPVEPKAPVAPEYPSQPEDASNLQTGLQGTLAALVAAGAMGVAGYCAHELHPLLATIASLALATAPTLGLTAAVGMGLDKIRCPQGLSDTVSGAIVLTGYSLAIFGGVSGIEDAPAYDQVGRSLESAGRTIMATAGTLSGGIGGVALYMLGREKYDKFRNERFLSHTLPAYQSARQDFEGRQESYLTLKAQYDRDKSHYDDRLQTWKTHRPETGRAVQESERQVVVGGVAVKRRGGSVVVKG